MVIGFVLLLLELPGCGSVTKIGQRPIITKSSNTKKASEHAFGSSLKWYPEKWMVIWEMNTTILLQNSD